MGLIFESWATDILVAAVSFCIFLYWFFNNNYDYWKNRNVPFCKPKPFVGNFYDRFLFKKSLSEIWQDIYNELEGEKIGGAWLVREPMLIVRDPEIIKRVLVKDFSHFQDRGLPVDEKRNPLSAHLFNLGGARWRALRAKLTPTFTSGKMKMMYSLMGECAHEFAQFVTEEARATGEVEFKEVLAKFTTDIIGTCAFGLQFNAMKNPDSEFRAMGRKVFAPSVARTLMALLFQFAPSAAKIFRIRFPDPEVSDFFLKAVHDTVEYREKNNIKRNDFLQLLIDLKNKGKIEDDHHHHNHHDSKNTENGDPHENGGVHDFELTNNLLAAQAFVFFLAGFETSSTTMSFALHELTVNLDVQEKLRNEIDTVLKETGGEITYEALKKMDYLEKVINESLRKYPPVAVLFRKCNKPYMEPDTGILVEEGMRVQIPVYALQHDPKYYPDPQRFDPERFSEEEKSKRPHYAFLPFGEGPRICIELTDNLLAAQAFVFFLAGFETSSTTMSFALHELIVNREIQEKTREEIDRVLEETGGEISYEAIRKMEYLDNVVNESLRKYPPLPVLMRICTKTFTEPETGAQIEKGTRVQIPVYALHHDSDYFPEPTRFDPDRFTEEEKAKRPNYVFLPFGEGPRVCIGLRFGLLQAKLGLAALLSQFDLMPSSRTPNPLTLDPRSFITASREGIWARVTPRNSARNL